MKKLLLTGLAVVTFGGLLNAQVSPVNQPAVKRFQAADAPTGKATVNHFGKTDISDWYFTQEFTQNNNSPINDGLKRYVAFLGHDSLAKYIGDDGVLSYGVNWISAGCILDPKDEAIDMTNNPGIKLDRYVNYRLDSININYLYVRNVDSLDDGQGGKTEVVDTLFVAYFRGNQITKTNLIDAQRNNLGNLGLVDWRNGNVRLPNNFVKMDTFLLYTGGDPRNEFFDTTLATTDQQGNPESSWRSKFATLGAPTGVSINTNNGTDTNNLVGFTMTFKSGIQTVLNGDTAVMIYQKDPATLPPGTRRTNYFGFGYNQNEGTVKWTNLNYYNTTLLAPKWSSYQPTTNGWDGYLSGNAFNGGENFIYADFKLTTTSNNVGINDIKNDRFALSNVYPNPATSNGSAVLGFSLKNNADVKITIVNLVGQEVKTIVSSKYVAGQHEVVFNLDGMQTGVYFVNMVVDGASQTKKLTITQ